MDDQYPPPETTDDAASTAGTEQTPVAASPSAFLQLTQQTVPLQDAQQAFGTPDAAGRLPIILLPTAPFRIRTPLILAGAVAIVAGLILNWDPVPRAVALAIGAVLCVVGIAPAFFVRIPEGANAILLRRGRFHRILGPGNQVLMPWIAVSHLVTSREIPFDVPAVSVPNTEGVRSSVDVLVTFRIVSPEKFVFAISAPDFDQVCQATGQDVIRRLIRATTTDGILDLGEPASTAIAEEIGTALVAYGVQVEQVLITSIRLPDDVMRSLEARRLASVQRAEEMEVHALRVQREADAHELLARRAEARRRLFEIEADNESFRLSMLEKRLADYPTASRWDFDGQRLEVARALAGNAKAIVQVPGGDAVTALLMQDGLGAAGLDPAVLGLGRAAVPAPPVEGVPGAAAR